MVAMILFFFSRRVHGIRKKNVIAFRFWQKQDYGFVTEQSLPSFSLQSPQVELEGKQVKTCTR